MVSPFFRNQLLSNRNTALDQFSPPFPKLLDCSVIFSGSTEALLISVSFGAAIKFVIAVTKYNYNYSESKEIYDQPAKDTVSVKPVC